MQNLSKPPVQKGHISEVEISDSSDDKENNVREAKSKEESSYRSPEKPQEEKEPSDKSLQTPAQRMTGKGRRNKETRAEEESSPCQVIAKSAKLTEGYNTTRPHI